MCSLTGLGRDPQLLDTTPNQSPNRPGVAFGHQRRLPLSQALISKGRWHCSWAPWLAAPGLIEMSPQRSQQRHEALSVHLPCPGVRLA